MGGGSKQDFDDKVGQAISLAGLWTQTVEHWSRLFSTNTKEQFWRNGMKG
jgi:hypothetical protein